MDFASVTKLMYTFWKMWLLETQSSPILYYIIKYWTSMISFIFELQNWNNSNDFNINSSSHSLVKNTPIAY